MFQAITTVPVLQDTTGMDGFVKTSTNVQKISTLVTKMPPAPTPLVPTTAVATPVTLHSYRFA
jgi:hypothetical protein